MVRGRVRGRVRVRGRLRGRVRVRARVRARVASPAPSQSLAVISGVCTYRKPSPWKNWCVACVRG